MRKGLLTLFTVLGLTTIASSQSILLGRATNGYTILRPQQNQVIANNDLNTIVFIHRQDLNVHGGSSGSLRYDISTDGGATWTNDIGILNPLLTRPARYPQVSIYNPNGNTNPTGAYLVWNGPAIGTDWEGHVNGTTPIVTTGTPSGTENYQFTNIAGTDSSGLPGGLVERVSGEFWSVEIGLSGPDASDTVNVYKGIYNAGTQNVDWSLFARKYIPLSRSFDGVSHALAPNIAFSPNGNTGYIALMGDINTADSVYNLVISKTTDGGTTWGSWNEVSLDNVAGILDTAQNVIFDDGNGGLIWATAMSSSFDFDITVDANGNPHIFTFGMVAEYSDFNTGVAGGTKQYSVYPGFPKYAWDITSTDGGTSWFGNFVSSIHTFRSDLPAGASIDGYPQISRTEDGNVIFYSWADSDTLLIGASNDNTSPNLRVAGYRITDGYKTCYKRIEGVSNEDGVYAPTMSPIVFEGGAVDYILPIVSMQILTDEDNAVQFHYMGAESQFCENEFQNPSGLDLSWGFDRPCYTYSTCFVSLEETSSNVQFNVFPNPTAFDLNFTINADDQIQQITVTNMLGQQVMVLNANTINTNGTPNTINVSNMADGIYHLNMITSNKTYTQKFTVSK